MNKSRIVNPNNKEVRDNISRTTEINQKELSNAGRVGSVSDLELRI